MKILGIETSCDETAAAIVQDGVKVLSNSVASSMQIHSETGGIIPERAARKQLEYMLPVLTDALEKAFPEVKDKNLESYLKGVDAIAVTNGPGLIGSLLVGVETAKTLALLFNKPLIPVNHVRAHIYANWIESEEDDQFNPPEFPLVALIASGNHSDIVLMKNHTDITLLGQTRDDAAGEAFDKCARLLGLPYPGGPAIAATSEGFVNPPLNLFPRALIYEKTPDVSFSGLKTAVLRYVEKNPNFNQGQIAAEVQEAIADALIAKVWFSISQCETKSFILSGGVAANSRLRQKVLSYFSEKDSKLQVYVPRKTLATDNAVMVASCAYFNQTFKPLNEVVPDPSLSIVNF